MDANELAHLHDTVLDATGKDLSGAELLELFETLPFNIRMQSKQWGLADTVVNDDIHAFLSGEL